MESRPAKNNRAVLFVNRRKVPGSRQPDLKGYGIVAGMTVRLAGWKNAGPNGKGESISIAIEVEDSAPAQEQRPAQQPTRQRRADQDQPALFGDGGTIQSETSDADVFKLARERALNRPAVENPLVDHDPAIDHDNCPF